MLGGGGGGGGVVVGGGVIFYFFSSLASIRFLSQNVNILVVFSFFSFFVNL